VDPEPAVVGAVEIPVAFDVEGGGVGFGGNFFGEIGRGWFGFAGDVALDDVAVGVADFVRGLGGRRRGVVAAREGEDGSECEEKVGSHLRVIS